MSIEKNDLNIPCRQCKFNFKKAKSGKKSAKSGSAAWIYRFPPVRKNDLLRCAAAPEKIGITADNGVWQPAGTEFSGDVFTVRKRIECYETVVLKIS